MHDLKNGDVFRFQDKPEEQWKASSDPYTIDKKGRRTSLRAATTRDPLDWAINAAPVNADGSRRVTEFSSAYTSEQKGEKA